MPRCLRRKACNSCLQDTPPRAAGYPEDNVQCFQRAVLSIYLLNIAIFQNIDLLPCKSVDNAFKLWLVAEIIAIASFYDNIRAKVAYFENPSDFHGFRNRKGK